MTENTEKKEVILANDTLPADLAGMFDLNENFESVNLVIPSIRILHQANMFEMPDGEKVSDFEGLIIKKKMNNAYWNDSFEESGGNEFPDCFSKDGVYPDPRVEHPKHRNCAQCPMNAFGSGEGGKGKACKNTRVLYILVNDNVIPYRLTLSPMNMKPFDMYITVLTNKGIYYQIAMTKFSLATAKNKDGIGYSGINFKNTGLEIEKARQVKEMIDRWTPVIDSQTVNNYEEE